MKFDLPTIARIDVKALGKVAVLMGGASAEREVSMMSGTGVLEALRSQGVDAHAFDPAERHLDELVREGYARCFIALHGRFGEDGTVQGALELLRVPYTGSGVMASSIAMDKIMTKRIWRFEGLPTPDWRLVSSADETRAALQALGVPMIVKPAREGSTIGLTKVTSVEQCDEALLDDFGQCFGDGPPHYVRAADQRQIGGIGQLEDVIRALEQRDGAGRLLEELLQPFDLGLVRTLGEHHARGLVALVEDADDVAVRVADRSEAVVPPGLLRLAVPHHRQHHVVEGEGFPGFEHALHLRADEVPDVPPYFRTRTPECPGVAIGRDRCPGIVVEQAEFGTPVDGGGEAGAERDVEREAQRLRPLLDRPERSRGPAVLADAPRHFTCMIQEAEPGEHRCKRCGVQGVKSTRLARRGGYG